MGILRLNKNKQGEEIIHHQIFRLNWNYSWRRTYL